MGHSPPSDGGPTSGSYKQATAGGADAERTKRPAFVPPPDIYSAMWEEGASKDLAMEIDPEKGATIPPATAPWKPGKCIPLAPQAPKYVISSPRIEEQKQFMRDYALVGKFLGLWPSERDLIRWIQYWWKPKGHYELQLGSKGFFTIIFYNLEDRNRIFDGGPYFFNSAGLFLRFWTEKFSPEKEDFAHAPVWIRLYSLPQEFWLEEVLAGIGNTIGIYVKSSEATKQRRYTSYARICVYLNITKALPGSITLEYQDEDWLQTIDYEHIPFRCRRCHEHGHLFRECPLINTPKESNPDSNKDKDGFTQPTGKRRLGGRRQPAQVFKDPSSSNRFTALQDQPVNPVDHPPLNETSPASESQNGKRKEDITPPSKEPEITPPSGNQEAHNAGDAENGEADMELEEPDLAGVDLEHLEHAYRQQKLFTIPRDQLRKVHKVYLNSSAGSTARTTQGLGIQSSQSKSTGKTQKDEKKRGRKSTNKLIQEIGHFMVNSGQIHLISDSFPPLPNPPSS
jgi:hypothetical protein